MTGCSEECTHSESAPRKPGRIHSDNPSLSESFDNIMERLRFDKISVVHPKKLSRTPPNDEKLFVLNKKVALYKTEMCKSFSELGYCKYAESCQFCHSEAELRKIERHPKYKTEICRTYWLEGSCPYGRRCCFAHRENLRRKNKISGSQLKIDRWQARATLSQFSMDIEESSSQDLSLNSSVFTSYSSSQSSSQPSSGFEKTVYKTNSTLNSSISFEKIIKEHPIKTKTHAICNTFFRFLVPSPPELILSNDCQRHYFTFNRFFQGEFEPVCVFDERSRYQSTWDKNTVSIWADNPILFIPKRT